MGHPHTDKYVRDLVKKRDRFRCTRCGCRGTKENPLTVHHKIPIRNDPYLKHLNDPDNLITLCRNCHDTVEKER